MNNIFRDHYTNFESQISKKFYYGTEIVNENMPLSYVSHIREVGNCLILGTTGAGKTVFLEKNIESLCGATKPEHLAIFLLNTKRDEYLYIKKQYKDFICNIDKKVIVNHQNDRMDSDVKIIESAILDAVNYQMILTNEGFDDIDEYNKHLESKGEPLIKDKIIIIDELSDYLSYDSSLKDKLEQVLSYSWKVGVHFLIASQNINSYSQKMILEVGTKVCFTTLSIQEAVNFISSESPATGKLNGDLWVYQPQIFDKIKHLYCTYPRKR